jgi:hypothetical protein
VRRDHFQAASHLRLRPTARKRQHPRQQVPFSPLQFFHRFPELIERANCLQRPVRFPDGHMARGLIQDQEATLPAIRMPRHTGVGFFNIIGRADPQYASISFHFE